MNEETAMEVAQPQTVQHFARISSDAIELAKEQRKLLADYIEGYMVDDVDYGVIPGTERKDKNGRDISKPTLLKPGAEKLVDIFQCEPTYDILSCNEDFDKPLFSYSMRCQLHSRSTGVKLAEGVGAANSKESRHQRRKFTCPQCGQTEYCKKSKKEEGYYCWQKIGGCGWKGPQAEQTKGDGDLIVQNTVLKMAKKRALVDAAIALGRCSDLFTQDLEEMRQPSYRREGPPRAAQYPDQTDLRVKDYERKFELCKSEEDLDLLATVIKSDPVVRGELATAKLRKEFKKARARIGGAA